MKPGVTPLASFPVDEEHLHQLERAMDPDEWGGVSRLNAYLGEVSAAALGEETPGWCYSSFDVIHALIGEVRRLRSELE